VCTLSLPNTVLHPSELEVLRRMDRRDREYLLWLWRDLGKQPHRWYSSPEIGYIASARAKVVLGPEYAVKLALLFEKVDGGQYDPGRGIATAYRRRKDIHWDHPMLMALLEEEPDVKRRRRRTRIEETRRLWLRQDRLQQIIDTADPRSIDHFYARFWLARAVVLKDGWIGVWETYWSDANGRRFMAGFGIQNAPKRLRQLVLGGTGAIEVDIHNALPSMIYQLVTTSNNVADRLGKPRPVDSDLPHLQRYCADRELLLAKIAAHYGIDRSRAKELILAISFGAKLDGWAVLGRPSIPCRGITAKPGIVGRQDHHPLVVGIAEEMAMVKSFLIGLHPEVEKLARSTAAGAMNENSAMALSLQIEENKVLQSMIEFFEGMGWQVCALLFDALIAYPRPQLFSEADLAAHVRNATGYSLGFKIERIEQPTTPPPLPDPSATASLREIQSKSVPSSLPKEKKKTLKGPPPPPPRKKSRGSPAPAASRPATSKARSGGLTFPYNPWLAPPPPPNWKKYPGERVYTYRLDRGRKFSTRYDLLDLVVWLDRKFAKDPTQFGFNNYVDPRRQAITVTRDAKTRSGRRFTVRLASTPVAQRYVSIVLTVPKSNDRGKSKIDARELWQETLREEFDQVVQSYGLHRYVVVRSAPRELAVLLDLGQEYDYRWAFKRHSWFEKGSSLVPLVDGLCRNLAAAARGTGFPGVRATHQPERFWLPCQRRFKNGTFDVRVVVDRREV